MTSVFVHLCNTTRWSMLVLCSPSVACDAGCSDTWTSAGFRGEHARAHTHTVSRRAHSQPLDAKSRLSCCVSASVSGWRGERQAPPCKPNHSIACLRAGTPNFLVTFADTEHRLACTSPTFPIRSQSSLTPEPFTWCEKYLSAQSLAWLLIIIDKRLIRNLLGQLATMLTRQEHAALIIWAKTSN